MSHVFISYCHADQRELDRLLTRLHDSGFTDDDIWYDHNLEAGGQWIPQIDMALAEAYAVIVVVTKKSMRSPYVTYEWSWAIGNRTPLVPLLMAGSYDDIHTRLREEFIIDCRKGIPERVANTVRNHQTLSPVELQVHKLIANTIMPFRILSRVGLWLAPYSLSGAVPLETCLSLIVQARDEGELLKDDKLAALMVDKSHVFTTRHNRICNTYIKHIEQFLFFLQPIIAFSMPNGQIQLNHVRHAERHRIERLEASIASIDPYGVPFGYYAAFDEYLNWILRGDPIPDEMLDYDMSYHDLRDNLLKRFLPEQTADSIWGTLENLRNCYC